MIAAVHQPLAGRARQPRRRAAQLELALEYRLHQRLGRRIRSIEYDQSVAAEQCVEPAAECRGDPRAGRVCSGQSVQRGSGKLRRRQRLAQLVETLADRRGQTHRRHRQARLRRRAQVEPAQLELAVEHAARADLVQVVILGIDPENGHGRDAVVGLDAARQRNCGERLEQREERTAEQTGLLPGDDGHRAGIRQASRSLQRRGRGVPRAQLGGRHAGRLARTAGGSVPRLDRTAPACRRGRIAGKERREPLEGVAVVARQRRCPGEAAEIDGVVE